jgi:1-deoxy-D-xylulose-5-phosphate reductoisomerase
MKKIAIMGSTGSIGTQALTIVRSHPQELQVLALTADTNVTLLEEQLREFRPPFAVMRDEQAARDLEVRVKDLPVKVLHGLEGLCAMAILAEIDMLVVALVGMIGIVPTIAAIMAGKDIALANKETLVTAGHIIMPLVAERGVRLLPIDSEHSAIFQALQGEKRESVAKIWLTASGGPFRGKTVAELAGMTAADALCHPNWNMGKKVTIDSATLVNKGLEVIEARWLFDLEPTQIKVVVHPQSIVHSLVEFVDGALIAQMGLPDMKLPIQYALLDSERRELAGESLDLRNLHSLTFEEADTATFRGLPLAYQALEAGGSMPTVYNAANEKAVARFLAGEIGFLDIYAIIEEAMARHKVIASPTVEEILEIEAELRAIS